MFTEEQIKQLEKLDVIRHFNTVLDSEFKRGTFRTTDEHLADIYEKATNTKVNRNFNCKNCVYNLYRNAGLLYRQSLEYIKKSKMEKVRQAKQNKKDKQIKENE